MIETPAARAIFFIGLTPLIIGIIVYVAIVSYIGKPLRYDYFKGMELERIGQISIICGIILFLICAAVSTVMVMP